MATRGHRNPVLETKRETLLAEERENRESLLQTYNESVSNTKHIHSSFLFSTENGRHIIKSICSHVSCVKPSVFNTSWTDLAAKLGYDDTQVKCVPNLQGHVHDPTQQILIYFAAKQDGSVGDLLQVLLDLGFLPALQKATQYIKGFIEEVEARKSNGIIVQIETEGGGVKDIVKSPDFNPHVPLIFDPLSSKTKAITTLEHNFVNVKEREALQMSQPHTRAKPQKKKQYCKIVMISFASDGLDVAKKMAQILRATKNSKGFSIGVVILSENEDAVLNNPGMVINKILPQVNFVIPVLTEGYFQALLNRNPEASLLDERYVQYIHNTMLSKFIENQCVNQFVRPLIPRQEVNNIFQKEEFKIDPLFKPFRTDDEMERLALTILKSRKEKVFT